jgi:hypothetical protein
MTLWDIEWNIDLSAQWLRKICSRDRVAEGSALNAPPSGMEFLRLDGYAWDLSNQFFMVELQSAYQTQGGWLRGPTFGDADKALRDVQEAWR